MHLAITAHDNELSVDGVRFTRTGLLFDERPTERTLSNVGRMLALMDSCTEWGWADYLPQLIALKQARSHQRNRRSDTPDNRQAELSIITEFSELTGQNAAQLHECDKVGRFFPREMRRETLTFAHHVEAFLHADENIQRACTWLDAAVEHRLTVPQLRAHIRREIAREQQPAPAEPSVAPPDVVLADMELAAARRLRALRTYDGARAAAELAAMRNTVALVDSLRALAEDLGAASAKSCQASPLSDRQAGPSCEFRQR